MKANQNNSAKAENTISGNSPAVKNLFSEESVKELIANEEVQKILRTLVVVPEKIIVKKAKNPFKNKDTEPATQKIEAMSGTTIEDAVNIELTLCDIELEPKEAINKQYRIIDYTFALKANMDGRNFAGYAATGLKLMVTKLEEVKGDEK